MCTSEGLTERRQTLFKWLKKFQEEINEFECDNKEVRRLFHNAHFSIVKSLQFTIRDIDFELEKIRVEEFEKSRVVEHEEKERDHETSEEN